MWHTLLFWACIQSPDNTETYFSLSRWDWDDYKQPGKAFNLIKHFNCYSCHNISHFRIDMKVFSDWNMATLSFSLLVFQFCKAPHVTWKCAVSPQCLSLVRNLNWLNPKWIHHCHCIVKASWKLSSFLLPCKVDLIHSITPVYPTVLPICFWDRHSSSSITTNAKIIPTTV